MLRGARDLSPSSAIHDSDNSLFSEIINFMTKIWEDYFWHERVIMHIVDTLNGEDQKPLGVDDQDSHPAGNV